MLGKRLFAIRVGLSVALFSLFAARFASAQPQLESGLREVDRKVREKIEQKMVTPPRKPVKIKEAPEIKKFTGPKLFVKSIKLEGVESFPVEDFKPIIEKYENREVHEDELKDILLGEIKRDYLRKGVIATCFIPPQKMEGDVLLIKVIEAKMGSVEVTKHRYFVNDRIEYYWPIKSGDVLRYDKMSRALQFMNKNPDRETKATLVTGKKPGTTDVVLSVKTYFPLHFTAMLDNEGSVPTGKIRKGLGIVENNLLGLDDILMAGYTGGKFFGGVYAYHRVPITPFGTSVMYGYSLTRAFPKKDFEQFGISSSAESYSAFLYQDLYTKDDYKGDISAGLEAKNKRVVADQGTLNADRLRILRLGTSLIIRDLSSITYIKPEYSQGLNMFGARRKSEFSSREAENTFSKVTLTGLFIQRFIKNIQAQIKLNAQLASEKIMPQEEFYMGGIDSIRGYPSGDYLADSGFTTNFEMLVPAFFLPDWLKIPYDDRPVKDEITGVLFFDYGYGMKRGEIQGELNKRKMASLGAGVRIRVLNQATFRLEWGFPLDQMANMPLTELDRSRVHFSLDFQDRMPQEIDRFREQFREDYIKIEAWQIMNEELKNPSSTLGNKMQKYFYLAEKAENAGDLQEAKKYYGKVSSIGRAAYKRAEVYLKETYSKADELKKEDKLAEEYYQKGDLDKAKKIWQNIKERAKLKPLTVDVL